jgi:hypothetical protein
MALIRLAALSVVACSLQAKVVINEISYHPPNDEDSLEFIELHNSADAPADLRGWKFTKGIKYEFTAKTDLPGKGFLVLARDAAAFKKHYGLEPAGVFSSSLKNSGENLELSDAQGQRVDKVNFKDDAPWPLSADGETATLERISPEADGNDPANWASSALSTIPEKPAGTPGKQNSNYAATLPPVISKVTFEPTKPSATQPVNVSATLRDGAEIQSVEIVYSVTTAGSHKSEQRVAMKAGGNQFTASIPAQGPNSLVRFRIEAVNRSGARRLEPGANEPVPAYSYLVPEKLTAAKIARAYVIHADPADYKRAQKLRPAGGQGMGAGNEAEQERFGARMMFEQGSDLSSTWADLCFTQKISHAQLTKLSGPARAQIEARQAALDTIDSSDEPMKDAQRLLTEHRTKLQEEFAPALTEPQRAALKPSAPGPRRQTPETVLARFSGLDAAFLYVSTRPDVSESAFTKLKADYGHWVAEGAKLVPAINDVMTGKGGDQQKVFEQMQNLNGEVTKAFAAVLPDENARKAFVDWRENNSPFRMRPPGAGGKEASPGRGRNAFVYVAPNSTEPELYDFVEVKPRNAGYKVHFAKRRSFQEMSSINILFEYNDRFVLAEALAYEVYRRAGNAAPKADFVRLHMDGRPFGYHLLVEQPNRAFLKRNKLRDDGNLYKILWYERGVARQHEKKTNPHTGHDDLLAVIEELEKTSGDEEWAVIKKHFNVPQVINYFAVNMVLSHWDGYFNNYFTYHDINGTKKWEIYPWDQDKTWGFHDAIGDQVFFDMPITYGMEGDRPSWAPKEGPAPQGFRGNHWWRAGGVFSKPLLANPHFRKQFLARTREILETVYTEKEFFPIIDGIKERLAEDVRLRAGLMNEDPAEAMARFERNIESLKEHLQKRRQFLLAQDEIKKAAKTDRAALN